MGLVVAQDVVYGLKTGLKFGDLEKIIYITYSTSKEIKLELIEI